MPATMLRLFAQHQIRPVVSLDGLWEFITASERRSQRGLPRRYTRSINVPAAWETIPGLETYRGTAWLRTDFHTAEAANVRLVFGGVSHTGTVFIDGNECGSHYDAFTPWAVVVPGVQPGHHELIVQVDNSFGDHSALHLENDYYTYGGITRPVELQIVPDVYIEAIHATPLRQGDEWGLELCLRITNCGDEAAAPIVQVRVAGREYDMGVVDLRAGSRSLCECVIDGLDVEPWSAESPRLYDLTCVLADGRAVIDDLTDRIGFRDVRVAGRKLLLNGEELRLQGFNRHEDHPQFGNALPVDAMVYDVNLVRDLGANFVRTCHYPNDMRFLDLCDELGIYVWEESHARQVKFDHPRYKEQITTSTTEMVDWHFNHPAIIIWGCLNECESITASGKREHTRVLRLLKELDGSRPVTFASMYAERDLCLGEVDIVSWNRYDAWYGGAIDEIEPRIKRVLRWLHSNKSRGGKGKPVIMSEFGAGAIYGNRQPCQSKWSEEYQRDVLDESLRVYLGHPDVVGAAIWQFCDVRITPNWSWDRRPRTMNNKGVVDEYRRPKLAYEAVKRRMKLET
jgi:beta-glucuronidase